MRTIVLLITLTFFLETTIAQDKQPVDKVIGIVGNNSILLSDIESMYLQQLQDGMSEVGNMKCKIFEDLLFQKLLIHQAEIDSIIVTDKEVEGDVERRLEMMKNQTPGGIKEIEESLNMKWPQIKRKLHETIKDMHISQRMQAKITEEVKITPSEVREYFKNLHKDSIPSVDTELEYAQILIFPKEKEEDRDAVKSELEGYRKRIMEASNPSQMFTVLARLNSEDPGSAVRGGELGFTPREALVSEFANAAFTLNPNEISGVIKTEYGYHIIQLIARKGNQVNVRHILKKTAVNPDELVAAKNKLDSIATLIRMDTLTFEKAALRFSDDEKTRMNGGLTVHPYTGESKFNPRDLDKMTMYKLKNLKIAEMTEPFEGVDEKGKKVYKILMLKSKVAPHKAKLKTDYQMIMETALNHKKMNTFQEWTDEKVEATYIKIDPSYKNCNFEHKGWIK